MTLRLPRRARVGEPVDVALTARNATGRPVTLELGGSAGADTMILFDVVVTDARGREVWRRVPAGGFVAGTGATRTLAPGQASTWTGRWDLRDAAGRRVPPGTYQATGALPLGLTTLRTKAATLVVQP